VDNLVWVSVSGGSGYVRSDDCGAAGCDRGCGDRGDGEVPGDTAVGGVCLIGRGCCFWCTWYVQRFNKLSINPSF